MIAKVYLSSQSTMLVRQLLSTGLYGASLSHVCQRIIEEKLREFVEVPKLVLRSERNLRRSA